MILYNPTAQRHRDRQPLPAGRPPRRAQRRPAGLPRRAHGRHGDLGHRREGRRAQGDVMAVVLARAARRATSSSPTSRPPACRSSPATRPTPDRGERRPARRAVPGDRRHVDVEPARWPAPRPWSRRPTPTWTPGPDQVGPDDLVAPGRGQGGRGHPGRPVRPRRRVAAGRHRRRRRGDHQRERRGLHGIRGRPAGPGRPQPAEHPGQPAPGRHHDLPHAAERHHEGPAVQGHHHRGERPEGDGVPELVLGARRWQPAAGDHHRRHGSAARLEPSGRSR